MKYADIEGLGKKDQFKKGLVDFLRPTAKNLSKHGIGIVPESLGEPAALLDFIDYDFYLAFKTDGVGTKSLIADKMAEAVRKGKKFKGKIWQLYAGLGIDLVASNVNDLICLGAKPIALSDEISAGDYRVFTDPDRMKGLFGSLKKGCLESEITIPCGESPTLTDIVNKKAISITGSSIGLIRPKSKAVFGQKLKAGDVIYGLASSGIHTNGLSLARKIVEKMPEGYFTPFGKKTVGEELLTPTRIYTKIVMEMMEKQVEIHYMSNISGSAFRKIMRAKKDFTYVIEKLPRRPRILKYLTKLHNIPDYEAYETWNMGLGFVFFAPENQEKKLFDISKKHKVKVYKLGWVERGPRKVVIRPLGLTY